MNSEGIADHWIIQSDSVMAMPDQAQNKNSVRLFLSWIFVCFLFAKKIKMIQLLITGDIADQRILIKSSKTWV